MAYFISSTSMSKVIKLNYRYQGADKVSDHVNRPVSRKTFDKSQYRGTKESKVMAQ